VAHSPQNFDRDFDQLCRSFEAIAQQQSTLRRRFELCKVAPFFGIPRSEFRRLFEIWLLETLNGGALNEKH
jgi:hypothetical protein